MEMRMRGLSMLALGAALLGTVLPVAARAQDGYYPGGYGYRGSYGYRGYGPGFGYPGFGYPGFGYRGFGPAYGYGPRYGAFGIGLVAPPFVYAVPRPFIVPPVGYAPPVLYPPGYAVPLVATAERPLRRRVVHHAAHRVAANCPCVCALPAGGLTAAPTAPGASPLTGGLPTAPATGLTP